MQRAGVEIKGEKASQLTLGRVVGSGARSDLRGETDFRSRKFLSGALITLLPYHDPLLTISTAKQSGTSTS